MPYSLLGCGFLTGRIKRYEDLAADDYRRHSPRFQEENFAKNLELVERVEQITAGKSISAGQLALAWVLARGKDIVPIPGTTRRKYLGQNIAAVDLNFTPNVPVRYCGCYAAGSGERDALTGRDDATG